jgi:hypothetical protein
LAHLFTVRLGDGADGGIDVDEGVKLSGLTAVVEGPVETVAKLGNIWLKIACQIMGKHAIMRL